jgi:hypothetical protein
MEHQRYSANVTIGHDLLRISAVLGGHLTEPPSLPGTLKAVS